jgi:hypothetical protein
MSHPDPSAQDLAVHVYRVFQDGCDTLELAARILGWPPELLPEWLDIMSLLRLPSQLESGALSRLQGQQLAMLLSRSKDIWALQLQFEDPRSEALPFIVSCDRLMDVLEETSREV